MNPQHEPQLVTYARDAERFALPVRVVRDAVIIFSDWQALLGAVWGKVAAEAAIPSLEASFATSAKSEFHEDRSCA